MRKLPFFAAVPCPRCDSAHDFYVPAIGGGLPYAPDAPDALYVYHCPVTALPELIAPAVAPESADFFTVDSVPLLRVG